MKTESLLRVLPALITGLITSNIAAQTVTVDTSPTGLSVTVDGTNYTAPAAFNWDIGSAHTIDTLSPQLAGDGHSRSIFALWSDGGNQNHSVIAPAFDTNYTANFSTQYLLDQTVSPSGAGTISNFPAGPWYNTGQLVSLTARTNNGFRINFWQGVDSAVSNVAQVTMDAYHTIQASFIAADYPFIIVTNLGGVAPGNIIGNIGGRNADGTKLYYVILDNTGTNLIYSSKTNTILRFVPPQGLVTSNDAAAFRFRDESITNVVDSSSTLGYTLDAHDVKLFPNGHSFVFGTEVRTFDMSAVVAGGKTAASVTGDVIQELDGNKRLVFEWHTFDYVPITNTFADMTQASFDYAHVNAIALDPIDNNLLASLRTTSEIVKINRRTGQIMWHFGGKNNMFAYIGEHPENAPYYTVGQHDIHRLPNGHLLYFDNGNISGGGVTPNDRTYTRAVEYALDETNMTATLVWEFRHTPDISAPCTGSVKRFANGNTLIDWGCAVPTSGFILTEVDPAGQVVFEMKHRTNNGIGSVLLGGGMTKQSWNSPDLIRSASFPNVQSSQSYTSALAGVSVTLNSLSGSADNTLNVERHLDAARVAKFAGKAPQVIMERVILSGSNITSFSAELVLDLPDTTHTFDTPIIHDPAQLTVYQRSTPGQGQFTALSTSYDSAAQKLHVTTAQMGEFVVGYPDVDETPYAPAVLSPADQAQVNQAQPVPLVWVPQGLVGSFDVQVATDPSFTNLLLDTNNIGAANFSFQNPPPNSQLFWRVRTVNQGGVSAWTSASFFTVPAFIQVTYPAGGEVWQRFQTVTITWVDNISENVALDLYLDGISNRTFIASTASSGSVSWTVGQFSTLPQSTNYTIKIRSVTTPTLFAFSQRFAIITNLTSVTIATAPTNLSITVDGTNYTAPTVFSWLPTSSHTVNTPSPQVAADGHSRFVFAAWSDLGSQSHSVTIPFSPVTNTASFATNYLLSLVTNLSGAGTITAVPAGPWYDLGQLVSLIANPNPDYLFYSWQGVDSQSNNTAQVTINGYKTVQANLMPVSGIPLISNSSFTRLSDGRIQFAFTAGAGVATQATVWGTATLSPPDWHILGTVPLSNGNGVFIDDPAPTTPARFYRVTLP